MNILDDNALMNTHPHAHAHTHTRTLTHIQNKTITINIKAIIVEFRNLEQKENNNEENIQLQHLSLFYLKEPKKIEK